jgi:hypothetical protein
MHKIPIVLHVSHNNMMLRSNYCVEYNIHVMYIVGLHHVGSILRGTDWGDLKKINLCQICS